MYADICVERYKPRAVVRIGSQHVNKRSELRLENSVFVRESHLCDCLIFPSAESGAWRQKVM